jgi:hypothetical protein
MQIRLPLALFLLTAGLFGAISDATYEKQPAILLDSGKVQVHVLTRGSTIASFALNDDPAKLNPMWNPMRLAREAGREATGGGGGLGHFVCVDGFGQPSAEEREAGYPGHGEAHLQQMAVTKSADSVSLKATLPIVQEVFTRTFHVVPGENVLYVDSVLENLLGFDRPVNWGEHATLNSPFLIAGEATLYISGTQSQNRPYAAEAAAAAAAAAASGAPAGGRGAGRGGANRRLASGADFTWPNSPGVDGKTINVSQLPDDPKTTDHTATVFDPSRKLEYIAMMNTKKGMIYGYVIRREDYPWIQNWGSYAGGPNALVRGMEFATQPYDISHRQVLNNGPMFNTPTFRWLPAKSKIESHFVVFFAHIPQGMKRVDDVRLENGAITVEDKSTGTKLTLAASRGLQ